MSALDVSLPGSGDPPTTVERAALVAAGFADPDLSLDVLCAYRAGYHDAMRADQSTNPVRVAVGMAVLHRMADELDGLPESGNREAVAGAEGLRVAVRYVRHRILAMATQGRW